MDILHQVKIIMDTRMTLALAGNPNCGKTTMYNALTGARQRVGNYPGVTVEHREGDARHNGLTAGAGGIDRRVEGSGREGHRRLQVADGWPTSLLSLRPQRRIHSVTDL